jgi:predicted nucleotidyltransferase component of viral defense system
MTLPPLPDTERLADLAREAAALHRVEPQLVEKDLYLTRVLWALGQLLEDVVLLKGGTLLSKVDLGFYRMSEDVDLVVPGKVSRSRGTNARRTNLIRDALKKAAPAIGARLPYPSGEAHERAAHVIWTLDYDSAFGPQQITVEGSIRPVLEPPRLVPLGQLIADPLAGDFSTARCWALSAHEARAEKVRAAFTREAIRDFYDLDRLADAGADFTSERFVRLVDAKLAELKQAPLAQQPSHFNLDRDRRRALETSSKRELPAVLRADAPKFDLDAVLWRFDKLWRKA